MGFNSGFKGLRKSSVRVQYIYYQKHPHIRKPTQTHTLQNPHIHTHTHTLQNDIKPPQYKLKQTQCEIYPNEIVLIIAKY